MPDHVAVPRLRGTDAREGAVGAPMRGGNVTGMEHAIEQAARIIRDGDYSHKVEMGGQDELTYLGAEFNDLTERLQTSEQKRIRFVSDASH